MFPPWFSAPYICSYILKSHPLSVKAHFEQVGTIGLCISTEVLAELYYGAARHPKGPAIRKEIDEFVSRLAVIPWDEIAADHYGEIRATMENDSTPIEKDHLWLVEGSWFFDKNYPWFMAESSEESPLCSGWHLEYNLRVSHFCRLRLSLRAALLAPVRRLYVGCGSVEYPGYHQCLYFPQTYNLSIYTARERHLYWVCPFLFNISLLHDPGIDPATCFCGIAWNRAQDIGRAAHSGHDSYQLYRACTVFIQALRELQLSTVVVKR